MPQSKYINPDADDDWDLLASSADPDEVEPESEAPIDAVDQGTIETKHSPPIEPQIHEEVDVVFKRASDEEESRP
jgi:hypothetical protein